VRQHLKSFWTPAMLRQLAEWSEAHAGEGLDPKVREALV